MFFLGVFLMTAVRKEFLARTLALGLFMAVAGLTYAASTGNRAVSGPGGMQCRTVGSSSIRFTNVLLLDNPFPTVDEYDLGDACFGSTITRYVTASGGLRPYGFSAVQINLTSNGGLLGLNSTLTFSPSGLLVGSVASAGTTLNNSVLDFQVTVKDSTGLTSQAQTLAGNFHINMLTCGGDMFRFAVDSISSAVLGLNYVAKLDTLGGIGTITYNVIPNTLMVNGVPKGVNGALESIGLSFSSNGTVYGRPLEVGLISFTARAVDSVNNIALDRSNTVTDQVITFNVEDNTVVSTDYSTLSCSISGDLGKLNNDSLKFSGNVNLRGVAINAINGGRFLLRVGGVSFEGRFNQKGQVVNQQGGPLIFADGSQMNVTVNPRTGQLKGSVKKATLGKGLDGVNIVNSSTKRFAVGVIISNTIVASDVLEFASRRAGDKFRLDYSLGKLGTPLAGAFHILSVKGTDKTTVSGTNGDAWAVKFLAIPRFGIDANAGVDAISAIGVRIGTRFSQRISSSLLTSTSNGNTTLKSSNIGGEVVAKFVFNARNFIGFIQTNPLSEFQTGLAQARLVAQDVDLSKANFNFGFDIDRSTNNADFSGDIAKNIIAVAPSDKIRGTVPGKGGGGIWVDQANLAHDGVQATP